MWCKNIVTIKGDFKGCRFHRELKFEKGFTAPKKTISSEDLRGMLNTDILQRAGHIVARSNVKFHGGHFDAPGFLIQSN